MIGENNSYWRFINKYKEQTLESGVYYERHHIIPKHMGGDNSSKNIILLTYRQHTLAHLLLYRNYGKFQDRIAYNLMRGLEKDRKSAIGKLIGQKHKESGHIYALGRKNVESGFFASIRTKETCSKGGKIGGRIARDTGQILKIRTEEGSRVGGEVAGKYATDRGQIQQLGKYKGIYVLISPDGREFQHAFQMSGELGIASRTLIDWCKNKRYGYCRRPKTKDELESRWDAVKTQRLIK